MEVNLQRRSRQKKQVNLESIRSLEDTTQCKSKYCHFDHLKTILAVTQRSREIRQIRVDTPKDHWKSQIPERIIIASLKINKDKRGRLMRMKILMKYRRKRVIMLAIATTTAMCLRIIIYSLRRRIFLDIAKLAISLRKKKRRAKQIKIIIWFFFCWLMTSS